jgi:hypothetical protein
MALLLLALMTLVKFVAGNLELSALPACAHDCAGLEAVDWESDHAACMFFSKKGFECLSDCAPDALTMTGGVKVPDFAKQCFWLQLGCEEKLFPKNPLAEGDSFCPEVCESHECLRTYEQLMGTKRRLDLHRRCAVNC